MNRLNGTYNSKTLSSSLSRVPRTRSAELLDPWTHPLFLCSTESLTSTIETRQRQLEDALDYTTTFFLDRIVLDESPDVSDSDVTPTCKEHYISDLFAILNCLNNNNLTVRISKKRESSKPAASKSQIQTTINSENASYFNILGLDNYDKKQYKKYCPIRAWRRRVGQNVTIFLSAVQ